MDDECTVFHFAFSLPDAAWRIVDVYPEDEYVFIEAGAGTASQCIACVGLNSGERDRETAMKDARLMAAAPELKRLADLFEHVIDCEYLTCRCDEEDRHVIEGKCMACVCRDRVAATLALLKGPVTQ